MYSTSDKWKNNIYKNTQCVMNIYIDDELINPDYILEFKKGGDVFDIGWAVDSKGQAVKLPGVDFIKIYTGVNQYCGWLGETSTEVGKIEDLHVLANQ